MRPKRNSVSFADVLNRERLGLIHRLLLLQIEKFNPAYPGLGHKLEQAMPELRRIGNVFVRDIGTIMHFGGHGRTFR